ncbi:putative serine/threonine-protein phosphatase [Aspergillus melleus]|uniref:putative serine/threonine-protein phosphatase n=1 Tax=Aspergillus melleus TaxID=138277 RepID=UPI001E8ED042|nr:uncharacterized protein LDX57_001232 [Aspergillus melleus]KAH8423472.1 hypothetical protein LDX57_001232 [Aspergillus melleus]
MTNSNYTSNENIDMSDDTSDDGLYHQSGPSYRLARFTRPLIDYVRNEWQMGTKYSHLPTSTSERPESPRWVQMITSIVTAPRFRRYVVVYLTLLISCFVGWKFVLSPRLEEHSALLRSLDPNVKDEVGGWFGANALPTFDNIVQLRDLDPSYLPAEKAAEPNQLNQRRLIMIGDVHGCKEELETLLEQIEFDEESDHLVFTGNLIDKGPDSLGVVDLVRKYSASCVRGNHEDRILVLRHDLIAAKILEDTSQDNEDDFGQDPSGRKLAREMTDEQAKWLDTCPVILNIGQIKGLGQTVVVHGGLVPGVDLEKQDPFSAMTMVTIDLERHVPSSSQVGTHWTKLYNKHQSLLYSSVEKTVEDPKSMLTTVIYGHDSYNSLSLKTYTKGLDTGCVEGGKLTALVISDGGEQKVVQVGCNDYSKNWT